MGHRVGRQDHCDVRAMRKRGQPPPAHNARLIAAAPAMFDALVKIHDDAYTACECGDIARQALALAADQ